MSASVVIRTYERREMLAPAVLSALGQTLSPREVIVVDDGSRDGTAAWLAGRFAGEPRLRVIRSERNQGAAWAANAGLAAAQGDTIAFLDSDDHWHPRFLELSLALLAAEPSASASYADYAQVWPEQALRREVRLPYPEDQRRAWLVNPFVPCLSLMLFRRDFLQRLGGFDPRWRIVHDQALLGRAVLAAANPFRHLPLPLAVRRLHGGNLIADSDAWRSEQLALVEELFARAEAGDLAALRPAAVQAVERRVAGLAEQRRRFAAPPQRSVSVVLPTRNRRALLERAIASVDAQSQRPLEIIVVDDGSTDGTPEWLASLSRPDLRSIAGDRPRGVGHARNLGWRASRGEIIAMLDDDDEWLPDYLAAVQVGFAALPEPLFVFTDCFDYRAGEPPLHVVHEGGQLYPDLVTRMLYKAFPHCSSVFALTRARLEAVGGYDESLPACEDSDLYLRLAASAGTAMPIQVERPLAMRLLHRSMADENTMIRATLRHHAMMLTKFFASAASAPYRTLAADVRRSTADSISRRLRPEAPARD